MPMMGPPAQPRTMTVRGEQLDGGALVGPMLATTHTPAASPGRKARL